ncbi:hypothetical protein Tco_1287649 [Tanacetum coccineum]
MRNWNFKGNLIRYLFRSIPHHSSSSKKDTTELTVPTGKGMMLVGNKDAEKLDPTRSVRRGTTVGMIRGKTNQKRPYEQAEQWINNEISFPFVPGCQLVDSPIILEALIKDFQLRMVTMEFAVVKSHSPYNVLLGRTDLRSLEGAASTIHLMIKFPTNNEIATMTTKRETLQEYRRIEEAQGLVSDIQQKGQKTEKNKQNQAREWKEYEKSKPKAYTSLMGQPEPILLGQIHLKKNLLDRISSISIRSSNVQPSEFPYLPVLCIEMSQSRQHDKIESVSYYLTD